MEELEMKESGGVRRPMNAFLIFCKRHRSLVREKNPHLDNRSVTRILGELWAKMPPDEKSAYTNLAKEYKEAFLKANPDYKWFNPEKHNNNSPGGQKPSTRPTNTFTAYHGQTPHSVSSGGIEPGKLAEPGQMGGLNLLLMAGQQALTVNPAAQAHNVRDRGATDYPVHLTVSQPSNNSYSFPSQAPGVSQPPMMLVHNAEMGSYHAAAMASMNPALQHLQKMTSEGMHGKQHSGGGGGPANDRLYSGQSIGGPAFAQQVKDSIEHQLCQEEAEKQGRQGSQRGNHAPAVHMKTASGHPVTNDKFCAEGFGPPQTSPGLQPSRDMMQSPGNALLELAETCATELNQPAVSVADQWMIQHPENRPLNLHMGGMMHGQPAKSGGSKVPKPIKKQIVQSHAYALANQTSPPTSPGLNNGQQAFSPDERSTKFCQTNNGKSSSGLEGKSLFGEGSLSRLVVDKVIESVYSKDLARSKMQGAAQKEVKCGPTSPSQSHPNLAPHAVLPVSPPVTGQSHPGYLPVVEDNVKSESVLKLPPKKNKDKFMQPPSSPDRSLTFVQIQDTLIRKAVEDSVYDFDVSESADKKPVITSPQRGVESRMMKTENARLKCEEDFKRENDVGNSSYMFEGYDVGKTEAVDSNDEKNGKGQKRRRKKKQKPSDAEQSQKLAQFLSNLEATLEDVASNGGEFKRPKPENNKKSHVASKATVKEPSEEINLMCSEDFNASDEEKQEVRPKKTKKKKSKGKSEECCQEPTSLVEKAFSQESEHVECDSCDMADSGSMENDGDGFDPDSSPDTCLEHGVRKSRRCNRGKKYQELIAQGFLQSMRVGGPRKLSESNNNEVKEESEPSQITLRNTRKRTVSETAADHSTRDPADKKFKTGEFDLEAHIASLPTCHTLESGKKVVEKKSSSNAKIRHHSDSSTLRKQKDHLGDGQCLNVGEFHLWTRGHKWNDPPKTPPKEMLKGSQKRKARKTGITHLLPMPQGQKVNDPQKSKKGDDGSNQDQENSSPNNQCMAAPSAHAVTPCFNLAALADAATAENQKRSLTEPVKKQTTFCSVPPLACVQ